MLDKQFNPDVIEAQARALWPDANFMPQGEGDAFCVMLPPPNVTGTLHMGHGFQHTLMDTLIRYQRMNGAKTLWQPGTDHAGIATQLVVEKQLARQNVNRKALSREAFIQKIWDWKAESGDTICAQMRELGDTVDWSRLRFTMDEAMSTAVTEAFVRLHEEGLIYRGKRLVNWDPVLLTAVSDLEVIATEEAGFLWYLRYPLVNPVGTQTFIVVATTRPETLFGDGAVAVHPDDPRYSALIGQHVQLPLTNRTIPIIGDHSVEADFGTGCVKITPAHDFNDYEMGKRHDLPLINILNPDATLNANVSLAYQGLSREAARSQVIQALTELGLIDKIEPYALKVPRSERSQTIIEPYLTEQWYVKMAGLAAPALAAVENGDIEFVPENWKNTYRQWLDNIQDWCISRQLWWGHRIPAWYDAMGTTYVGRTEAEVRSKYALAADIALTQDEDVLDTWFSSALWPFSTLGWPAPTLDLATFYPSAVLVTGFDIIFFWVARMVMFGLYFLKQVPFKKVLFTGLIRDSDGAKMSKSKGNVLDPLDVIHGISLNALLVKRTAHTLLESQVKSIEQATIKQFPAGIPAFGTDALRFTYCALATHGRDIRFDMNRVEGYRNFCNKLWNATRFIEMQLEQHQVSTLTQPIDFAILAPVEQWILTRLNATITAAHQAIDALRFDLLAQVLYEFVWNDFCDWYVELAKISLNAPDVSQAQKEQVLTVIVTVLEHSYRLLHPIIPFITEVLWQHVAPVLGISSKASILLAAYPKTVVGGVSKEASQQVALLQTWVGAIRQLRSEYRLAPGVRIKQATVTALPNSTGAVDIAVFSLKRELQQLAKIDHLTMILADDTPCVSESCAVQYLSNVEISFSLEGLVDVEAERARIRKELLKWQLDLDKLTIKLANSAYLEKAPAAVVAKEQLRLQELSLVMSQLQHKLV